MFEILAPCPAPFHDIGISSQGYGACAIIAAIVTCSAFAMLNCFCILSVQVMFMRVWILSFLEFSIWWNACMCVVYAYKLLCIVGCSPLFLVGDPCTVSLCVEVTSAFCCCAVMALICHLAIWACCTTRHSVLTSSSFTNNIFTTLLVLLVVVTSKRGHFSQCILFYWCMGLTSFSFVFRSFPFELNDNTFDLLLDRLFLYREWGKKKCCKFAPLKCKQAGAYSNVLLLLCSSEI